MEKKQRRRLGLQIPFLLFLVIGTVIIIRQQHNTTYQHNAGKVFGTTFSVTYQHDRDLEADILAELQRVDDALSMFNESSIISQVNRNEAVEVNDLFTEVFMRAQEVAKETDGAFDITVAPLVNLWGFGFKNNTPPSQHAIDSIRKFVGYKGVSLEGKRIRKTHPETMLDCSAIAKGFGSDRVAKLLRQKGVDNFMVEIGGEIVTQGINEKRLPWRIGVTKPSDDSLSVNEELQTVLNVTDVAMATSGNYRRFYYKDGKKFAHTIDPKTGRPVQHSLLSATVLAKDCATADAFATSFMVMGIDRAKALLAQHSELMAYFIYTDAQGNYAVWYSPSMKNKVQQQQ